MPDNPFPAVIKYHPAHSWETPDTARGELENPNYEWKGTQLMMWDPAYGWSIVEIDWERK